MAAFVTLYGLHSSLLRSQFLGQDHHLTHHFPLKHPSTLHHSKPTFELQPHGKLNILEIMGGRGICKGELGLEQELKRPVDDDHDQPVAASGKEQESLGETTTQSTSDDSVAVPEGAFEKEMMGLTGGFPGGEKGLKKFIEENPPPKPGNDLMTLKEAKAIS